MTRIYINHQYHAKRCLYLCVIRKHLLSSSFVEKIEWSTFQNEVRKPVLVVFSAKKLFQFPGFSIRLIPSATSMFSVAKLSMSRNSVRSVVAGNEICFKKHVSSTDKMLQILGYLQICTKHVSQGNTYWVATDMGNTDDTFLVCFDFTSERFPLPEVSPSPQYEDTLTLSTVRGEQLVVLFQCWDSLSLEIFITCKIESNSVSWSNKVFLQVQMRPLAESKFSLGVNFFIDEEKKVAVVFAKESNPVRRRFPTRAAAYILGVDGSMKEVDLGESPNPNLLQLS